MVKTEQLLGIGILLIVIGFLIIFFSMLKGSKETSSKTKVAVGGFIGPIPFGFGNDRNFVRFVTILSAVIFILWIIFSYREF